MTVPTTNIKFNDIQTEYGGDNPIALSEYYRGAGGGYVPSGQTSSFGTIPTSGAIALGIFRSTTKVVSGAIMTTGSTATIVSGGKGLAAYSLYSHGFSPGSSTSGNYEDYENEYSIGYAPIGSATGLMNLSFPLDEMVWHSFSSEDGQLGYYEYKLRIVVTGNIGGAIGGAGQTGTAFTPYVNGTAIAGAKVGVWGGLPPPSGPPGGTGKTVFTWIRGVRPNSSQAEIPGSDNTLVTSNPFGSNGSTPTVNLI